MLDTELEFDRKLRALFDHIKTEEPPASLALLKPPPVRSRHGVLSRVVAIAAVAALAAAIGLFASELNSRHGTSPTPTIQPASTPSPKPTPTPLLSPGVAALTAGTHAGDVLVSGVPPLYTVVVPKGWFEQDGQFIITGATDPVLGFSVWEVDQVYRDPCHWQGQGFNPGPSVEDLVAALVAQKTRNATAPIDVTLAGYAGKYLEWSVPADLKSSAFSQFDACDDDGEGNHNFNSWYADGVGYRYEEVPGQVDQLWILDVNGQRLVVDATYDPNTSVSQRAALERIVDSLRFVPSPTGSTP
jgi:hypothetical protein